MAQAGQGRFGSHSPAGLADAAGVASDEGLWTCFSISWMLTTSSWRKREVSLMSEWPMAPDWQASQWFNTGAPLDLARLRGRVVLLHAFQMLCPGCVSHAVPQAERVHREYGNHGVAVVGLHTVFEHHEAMTPVALAAFLHEYRVTHPVGIDARGAEGDPLPQTMRRYGMQGTPSLMLIDRAGRLRLHEFGLIDDLRLGTLLGSLLADETTAGRGDAGEAAIAPEGVPAGPCDERGCPVSPKQ